MNALKTTPKTAAGARATSEAARRAVPRAAAAAKPASATRRPTAPAVGKPPAKTAANAKGKVATTAAKAATTRRPRAVPQGAARATAKVGARAVAQQKPQAAPVPTRGERRTAARVPRLAMPKRVEMPPPAKAAAAAAAATHASRGSPSLHTAPGTPGSGSMCSARSDDEAVVCTPLAGIAAAATAFTTAAGYDAGEHAAVAAIAAIAAIAAVAVPRSVYGAPLDALVVRRHARLGEGAYGVVYKGVLDGTSVAVKTMRYADIEGLDTAACAAMARNEAATHADLPLHENIVGLVGAAVGAEEYTVVTELCDDVTLEGEVTAGRRATWGERVGWVRDVARGVAHTHAHGVVHRDLKPGNVLFAADAARGSRSRSAKVADFGLAVRAGHVCPEAAGTAGYVAPEAQAGGCVAAFAQDVYALGVMLLEVATAQDIDPFPSWVCDVSDLACLTARMRRGATRVGVPAGTILPGRLQEVIERCTAADAGARPSMAAVAAMLDAECRAGYAGEAFAGAGCVGSLWMEEEAL